MILILLLLLVICKKILKILLLLIIMPVLLLDFFLIDLIGFSINQANLFVVGILKPLMVQLLMLFIILLIVLLIIIPSILILIDLYLILKIIKVIMIICRKLIFSISNDFFRFKWICLLQKLKVFSLLSSLKLNLVFLLMLVLGLFCNSSSF